MRSGKLWFILVFKQSWWFSVLNGNENEQPDDDRPTEWNQEERGFQFTLQCFCIIYMLIKSWSLWFWWDLFGISGDLLDRSFLFRNRMNALFSSSAWLNLIQSSWWCFGIVNKKEYCFMRTLFFCWTNIRKKIGLWFWVKTIKKDQFEKNPALSGESEISKTMKRWKKMFRQSYSIV